ncbi:class II aldolase [Mesorhizobium sanjuanii]|uniref:Class II aldolase n=1 Tax=Mesorhizobium sanjuanii TaxID=2037900 RepID=A0A2A6FH46_9HYPH|nr:L-fuculose-phosphate aldolase [Mesorhizobium sanjuanii]PDQ21269.1 class II aldolase [Mesorhizobium sanjuanii]
MSASDTQIRQSIIDACIEMNRVGINQGTSGNISVRHGEGMLITPTSTPYETLEVQDIVFMNWAGDTEGRLDASSEWRFHLDILKARPEVNAIVHAHPNYCTTIAIMGRKIPAIHYMIAVAGGNDIRCAPYATFGTAELSVNAVKALEGRKACLLAQHGMIAVGTSLDNAMWLAVEVETLARQYHGCLQIGEPPLLSDAEIQNVLGRMASYGRRDDVDAA